MARREPALRQGFPPMAVPKASEAGGGRGGSVLHAGDSELRTEPTCDRDEARALRSGRCCGGLRRRGGRPAQVPAVQAVSGLAHVQLGSIRRSSRAPLAPRLAACKTHKRQLCASEMACFRGEASSGNLAPWDLARAGQLLFDSTDLALQLCCVCPLCAAPRPCAGVTRAGEETRWARAARESARPSAGRAAP